MWLTAHSGTFAKALPVFQGPFYKKKSLCLWDAGAD